MKTSTTMTANELRSALADMHALLAEGKFLEAMGDFSSARKVVNFAATGQ